MPEVGVGTVPIKPGMDGFSQTVSREVEGALSKVSKQLTTFGRSAFQNGARMSAAITLPIVAGFKKAFDAASDLNETVSKSNTIFGQGGAAIEKWAGTAATRIGQSKNAALDAAGTFGNLFTQLGIGGEQAAVLSTQMVELGSDFASFHNADISEVISAQTAAFRGEYDALQRFVPTINAAAVEQKALAMTGKASTKELTLQEKALATQTLMMEGAGEAVGDFARTSGGAANQQRILQAQLADSAATIGQQLLPIGIKLIGWIKEAVQWFANLAQPMQGIILVGLALLAAIGPIVTIVGALSIALGVLLSPVTLIVLGIAALVAGLIYAYTHFEGFRNAVDSVVAFLTDTAWPLIQQFAAYIVAAFGDLVVWVQKHWAAIQEAIDHVVNVVEGIIRTVIDVVSALWRAWGDDLVRLVQVAWDYIRGTVENAIKLVQGIIETVLAIINGDWGDAWDGIKKIIDAVWSQIRNVIQTALDIIKGLIGGVLSTIAEVWRGAWEALKGVLVAAWQGLQDAVGAAINGFIGIITALPGRILDAIGSLASLLYDKGKEMIGGLVKGVVDAIPNAAGAIGRAIGGLAGNLNPAKLVPHLNSGGIVPGGGPNSDSVHTMLTPGEFVFNRKAVQTMGASYLSRLNAVAGGYNAGGTVRDAAIPAGAGSFGDMVTINFNAPIYGVDDLDGHLNEYFAQRGRDARRLTTAGV